MTRTVTSNAKMYQVRYNQRARDFKGNLAAAMKVVEKQALKVAKDLSSGPYKQRTLTRMGHPYARRNPFRIGADYPARINVQTGAFRSSWKTDTRVNLKSISVRVRNTDPKARKWLTERGTGRMVGRPVLKALAKRVTKPAQKELRAVPRKSIGRPVGAGTGAFPNIGDAFVRGFQRGRALVAGL